ncbi:MAG: glycosyltransferase [Betaproteobacteria bacterium]|nr:glycosyltransferase [Betaproteobacteria bacterium]
MKLSVVLSFRNEAETIPELVQRLKRTLGSLQLSYEVIFVNDDSTDESLNILKQVNAEDGRFKILNMSRNFGNAPCALAGFRYARGDAVLVMDADLQDPPELIPRLLEEFEKGADVVYTTRKSRAGENPLKMLITKWAYRVLRYTSNINLPVDSGDFKLMSKRVVRELLKLNEYDPFLRGLVSWVGFRQVQVLYDREARSKGETHYPLFGKGPVRAFLSGLTSFSTLPLELALLLGFFVAVAAWIYLIAVLIMWAIGWNIPGWTTLVGVILVLGGTQLLIIGMNGIYLGRIYNNVQNRPNFIVQSTVGFDNEGKSA